MFPDNLESLFKKIDHKFQGLRKFLKALRVQLRLETHFAKIEQITEITKMKMQTGEDVKAFRDKFAQKVRATLDSRLRALTLENVLWMFMMAGRRSGQTG